MHWFSVDDLCLEICLWPIRVMLPLKEILKIVNFLYYTLNHLVSPQGQIFSFLTENCVSVCARVYFHLQSNLCFTNCAPPSTT